MNSPEDSRSYRLASALVRRRTPLLLATLALFALGLAGAYRVEFDPFRVVRRLQFDQSIEALYAPDDPYLQAYLRSKRLFGGDEFVIVAFRDPELFEPDSWDLTPSADAKIRALADALNAVPGVQAESTQNLADALVPEDMHPAIRRMVRTRHEELRGLAEGIMMGDDRETTAVVLRLVPEDEAEIRRGETITRVRSVAADFAGRYDVPEVDGDSVFVVGEPVQIHDLFRYVEEDGETLFWWSLALLAVVLVVLFRSARWVLLPLGLVVATIVWTQAVLVASGLRLSMVSSIMYALVTIIGVATVTHVTVMFREERRRLDRPESLRRTLGDLLPAIFWVTLTTAFGFTALMSSDIGPVFDFNLIMTIATMLVLLAFVMLLPGGILAGRLDPDPRDTPGEGRLLRGLDRVTHFVERRPWGIAGVTVALAAFLCAGLLFLEVETDFSRNFRADSEIVRSLDFVESRLGGAGNWEVNFPAPRELTPEYLTRVRRLAGRLRELRVGDQGMSKVLAVTDGLDMVPEVPFFMSSIEDRLGGLGWIQPEFVSSLYNPEKHRMRIVLRARERQQADTKLQLIARAEGLARETFPAADFPNEPPPEATGLFVLLTHLIDSLLGDQVQSFVIAALGMTAMMWAAFRNLRIALISLAPNLLPIALVVGGMGWVHLSGLADAKINIGTAMIASVSIGLTIDTSILYIDTYVRALRRGLAPGAAIREAHQDSGRALVFTNLALIVGFSALTFSHFIPLVYFGILVGVAMLGGLLGNLVLLPLLLPWATRGDSQSGRLAPRVEPSTRGASGPP